MAATLFYILLAFIVGLLLGWLFWGRLRGECAALRACLDGARSERDGLKADTNRLKAELEVCGNARADLAHQLSVARVAAVKSPQARAALVSAPAAGASSAPSISGEPIAKADAASAAGKAGAGGVDVSDAADARSARPKAANSAGKDNLRRLIGIGPANERRLNEHGIRTFTQIAAWTASDIKKVEEYLQFDGRIEREHWVEQAKLLAAGNEREFARRFPTAGRPGNI